MKLPLWKMWLFRRSKTGFGIWDLPRKSFTRAKFGPFGLNWDFFGTIFGPFWSLFSLKCCGCDVKFKSGTFDLEHKILYLSHCTAQYSNTLPYTPQDTPKHICSFPKEKRRRLHCRSTLIAGKWQGYKYNATACAQASIQFGELFSLKIKCGYSS